ncbi:hypothetical protein E1286_42240 [Nonomuraea terrae]|uniref:Uncharacterized protein n=1 Tax=Nonomuraea terrae TaxID=2530383 RepID=A0A4R4XPZ6_9ACTN|nr:hypothetical protein [Nonomuraea terrae]TDD33448.1 hypothetical protein E1286_42240 [Nonomuraea terrae]
MKLITAFSCLPAASRGSRPPRRSGELGARACPVCSIGWRGPVAERVGSAEGGRTRSGSPSCPWTLVPRHDRFGDGEEHLLGRYATAAGRALEAASGLEAAVRLLRGVGAFGAQGRFGTDRITTKRTAG